MDALAVAAEVVAIQSQRMPGAVEEAFVSARGLFGFETSSAEAFDDALVNFLAVDARADAFDRFALGSKDGGDELHLCWGGRAFEEGACHVSPVVRSFKRRKEIDDDEFAGFERPKAQAVRVAPLCAAGNDELAQGLQTALEEEGLDAFAQEFAGERFTAQEELVFGNPRAVEEVCAQRDAFRADFIGFSDLVLGFARFDQALGEERSF